jgi:superfamily I DNA/RNA helicase
VGYSRLVERTRDLQLGAGDPSLFDAAATAVRQEYEFSSRARMLHCREVRTVDRDRGLYCLVVGEIDDADWTWEGAVAVKPADLDDDAIDDEQSGALWRGDVVDVDDVVGEIYVDVGGGGPAPTRGRFFVKPFEFLAALDAAYGGDGVAERRAPMASALEAAAGKPAGGGIAADGALPGLERIWGWSWGALWGPPGTGKTWTIGRQIASSLISTQERILVVSTTNKATDGVAVAIGTSLRRRDPKFPLSPFVVRPGAGADIGLFERNGIDEMLPGDVHDLRRQMARLHAIAALTADAAERARFSAEIAELRKVIQRASRAAFCNPNVRTVIATCFSALSAVNDPDVRDLTSQGRAPFDTVVVDESGLVSRAAVAALSVLAARRFVLVGDPRQLAPISKISRVLPEPQARWLAESGLAHLEVEEANRPGVHLLEEQHRMTPPIRAVVSAYQYGGRLRDGDTVLARANSVKDGALFDVAHGPAAVWYVLDEEPGERHQIRAERGPSGKSWVRRKTLDVLDRLFESQPELRNGEGLFVSPYRAQARAVHRWLAERDVKNWRASTVHKQQGAEADHVIFDTVHAGSTGWPHREWMRLVNVGISRARKSVIVLASRDEMQEPYLAPLQALLSPCVLRKGSWHDVERRDVHRPSAALRGVPGLLGTQIEERRAMRPLMSAEQERLCQLELDSGPRLVRGVAGSGKTVVLAHWLARTLGELSDDVRDPLWVVYGNIALEGLLDRTIRDAWQTVAATRAYPEDRVQLWHVGNLIEHLVRLHRVPVQDLDRYDYNARSDRLLEHLQRTGVEPVAHAAFIDEAQDFGPRTLELIAALVRKSDPQDPRSQPVRIFYDNAQNVYERGTPNWASLGLDMRGRSTVMKESFRGTRPIAEFALNVLCRLSDAADDPDHRELVQRRLVEKSERNGRVWWRVHYVGTEGPAPTVQLHDSRDEEIETMARQVRSWIVDGGVRPSDIRVVTNGEDVRRHVVEALRVALTGTAAEVLEQRSQKFTSLESTVVVTTAHSFKGHDAEVVCVVGVDGFASSKSEVLAHALYVALTRARSVLRVSGVHGQTPTRARITDAVVGAVDDLNAVPGCVDGRLVEDELDHAIERLGEKHADWLRSVWEKHSPRVEPLLDERGGVLAEPLFWFDHGDWRYACFDNEAGASIRRTLEERRIKVLEPGGAP